LRGGGEDLFFAPGEGEGHFAKEFDDRCGRCARGFDAASATASEFDRAEGVLFPARAGSISFGFVAISWSLRHYNTYVLVCEAGGFLAKGAACFVTAYILVPLASILTSYFDFNQVSVSISIP